MSGRLFSKVRRHLEAFRGLRAVDAVGLRRAARRHRRADRPERRRQDDALQPDRRGLQPDTGRILLDGSRHHRAAPRPGVPCRHRPDLQIVRPFGGAQRRRERHRRRLAAQRRCRAARRARMELLERLGLAEKASSPASPDPARAQAARDGAGAGDRAPRSCCSTRSWPGCGRSRSTAWWRSSRRSSRETGLTILLTEHVMRAVMALLAQDRRAASRPEDRRGLARNGRRAIPRCCNAISAARQAVMLEVRDLDLFYGDAQALDGVALEVAEREIVAIVGANGAGKTSLIRTIAGMHRPRAARSASRAPRSPASRAIASAISASARSPKGGRSFPT